MNAPYRQQDLDAARHLIEKPMLLSSEARYALQLAVAEIDRCHARIDELLAANNREMTEAERLQKIVLAQEKELKRLRWLLGHARVACTEIDVDETDPAHPVIRVTVTCIGCDEYHFIEKCKPEIQDLIERCTGAKAKLTGEATDTVSGEPLEGGVAP